MKKTKAKNLSCGGGGARGSCGARGGGGATRAFLTARSALGGAWLGARLGARLGAQLGFDLNLDRGALLGRRFRRRCGRRTIRLKLKLGHEGCGATADLYASTRIVRKPIVNKLLQRKSPMKRFFN